MFLVYSVKAKQASAPDLLALCQVESRPLTSRLYWKTDLTVTSRHPLFCSFITFYNWFIFKVPGAIFISVSDVCVCVSIDRNTVNRADRLSVCRWVFLSKHDTAESSITSVYCGDAVVISNSITWEKRGFDDVLLLQRFPSDTSVMIKASACFKGPFLVHTLNFNEKLQTECFCVHSDI